MDDNKLIGYYLEIVGLSYELGEFDKMLELISDDCRWDSQWVIEPRIGKDVLTEYYTKKGEAMRGSDSSIRTRVIRFCGGLGHARTEALYINGKRCAPHSSCGIYVPAGELGLELVQTKADGEKVGVIIRIQLDKNGKISKIDLNDPAMYGPYEAYQE